MNPDLHCKQPITGCISVESESPEAFFGLNQAMSEFTL